MLVTTKSLFRGPSRLSSLLIFFLYHLPNLCGAWESTPDTPESIQKEEKDFRWPDKRLNVLVDARTINETERQILAAVFDQIEHKTCVTINRLPQNLNPFDVRQTDQVGSFIYMFKSQFGHYNRHPSLGLSSFGCLKQGRQSMVLTDWAFRWPDVVLRYHLLRSLGVEGLQRPDEQVRLLMKMLPLNQKINDTPPFPPSPFPLSPIINPVSVGSRRQNEYVYSGLVASLNQRADVADGEPVAQPIKVPVQYLSEQDLDSVKKLYQCSDYQNQLSLKPLNELDSSSQQSASLYTSPSGGSSGKAERIEDKQPGLGAPVDSILKVITDQVDNGGQKISDSNIDEAAKSIVDYLLSESNENLTTEIYSDQTAQQKQEELDKIETLFKNTNSSCKPLDSCPIENLPGAQETGGKKERPMLLKLDSFHASDPELSQANQMYLSQPTSSQRDTERQETQQGGTAPSTYRLMDAPEWRQQQQPAQLQPPKSEMMISFEQADQSLAGNPVAALAGSKVLKLCSCTCQTMRPSPDAPPPASPATPQPPAPVTSDPSHDKLTSESDATSGTSTDQFSTMMTTTTTTTSSPTPPQTSPEPETTSPTTSEPVTEPTTAAPPATTGELTTVLPTTSIADASSEPTTSISLPEEYTQSNDQGTTQTQTQTQTPANQEVSSQWPTNGNLALSAACDQVEWVRPNKSVYASDRIVWDIDSANQNYFLCNDMTDNQLVPGKTHGFACKISNEGRAYELHNFNVLTKPTNVRLAWVQHDSKSFGTKYMPVVGGFSKTQDPYVVSRCLVRDENKDVITLIGYVDYRGVSLFPFDDIQIECTKYDVLACEN